MGLGSEKSILITISTTPVSILLDYSKSTSWEVSTFNENKVVTAETREYEKFGTSSFKHGPVPLWNFCKTMYRIHLQTKKPLKNTENTNSTNK